ncbi:putative monocarboxylate transporter mch1 [Scheffersomyces spartinae]|uniref:Probable transporter MCH1 n=1 Tax=Scheffersomyces spartinae TaxID=45513 RepID=A0A9P7V771_9ASCO|nr:putative monocarboxylate transporter mch1 [Scheffersomyces spartinae]KAG7192638.1 putative monocarboxylate transporter mch1 [Scheffersomyces spartinae]
MGAFVFSLISCLAGGSILLFSLFGTSLHDSLGLLYVEINFIASLSAFGMYLCLPILGYLSDVYGPALLSLISVWFFCPSYLINLYLVSVLLGQKLDHSLVTKLSCSFCLIGLATSALYFSSLLTCAKIYPKRKGLAISLPVSCYGLSSFIGSQLLKLDYFQLPDQGGTLDLVRTFSFFGWMYLLIGVFQTITSALVNLEMEIIVTDEESPLMNDIETQEASNLSLIPSREIVEPENHYNRFVTFLKDKSAWVLLVSLIFNIGPLESYQNNLGSVLRITTNAHGVASNLSNQLSVSASSSTVLRLATGWLSDYISHSDRKYPISRMWLLIIIVMLGGLGQWALIYYYYYAQSDSYWFVSMVNGGAYGGIFTLYPTVIASIWGVDLLGSTWGSFMVAPAIGSIIYSLSYGNQVDGHCVSIKGQNLIGQYCLSQYFKISGLSMMFSVLLLIIAWRRYWVSRGFSVF